MLWSLLVAGILLAGSIVLTGPGGPADYVQISRTMWSMHAVSGLNRSMPTIKGITDFFGGSTAAWAVLELAVVGMMMLLKTNDAWACSGLVICSILAAPHFLVYDLGLALIVVALLMAETQISPPMYWLMFLLLQLPFLFYLEVPLMHWPILPTVLGCLFIRCTLKVTWPRLVAIPYHDAVN